MMMGCEKLFHLFFFVTISWMHLVRHDVRATHLSEVGGNGTLFMGNFSRGEKLEGRIVNGTKASPKQFPYLVSLRRAFTETHFCGGSIVSESWIVSAAHCMFTTKVIQPSSFFVVGGDVQLQPHNLSHTQQRQISSFIVHPKYNTETLENDIALIKVKTPFKFTVFLMPIEIQNVLPKDNSQCLTAGWGYQKENVQVASNDLLYIDLPLLNRNVCRQYLSHLTNMPPGMICAGHIQGGKDACQGDSGGPLTCNNFLTGVVSGGEGCARPRRPGIYTDVAFYRNWIGRTIRSSSGNLISSLALVTSMALSMVYYNFSELFVGICL